MWPPRPNSLPPELFFVAPASSFHHHHHSATVNFDPHSLNASNVGTIPLLTATPCIGSGGGAAAADEEDLLNKARSRGQGHNSYYMIKGMSVEHSSNNLLQLQSGSSSASATCQDCGNQAKKDCPHRRCRTCCKSRNYDCTTHLKSTWVPAARRRERHLLSASSHSHSTSATKKPRLGLGAASQTTTATSNTTQPRSFDTTSTHQEASFKGSLPGQVRAPAVFKCVRVTAVEDGEDEYAYQAVVKIGGHVFKGFLYDQGVEGRDHGLPNLSELHLGGGGGRNGGSHSISSPPVPDNIGVYGAGASAAGMLGGSTY